MEVNEPLRRNKITPTLRLRWRCDTPSQTVGPTPKSVPNSFSSLHHTAVYNRELLEQASAGCRRARVLGEGSTTGGPMLKTLEAPEVDGEVGRGKVVLK